MLAAPAGAETLRLATYSPALSREGPGLLLRDIEAGKDAQVSAVLAEIAAAHPDVLLLTDFDWDYSGAALEVLTARLERLGLSYPYSYAPRPNTGTDTGLDIDGNGKLGEARDAQGYGAFTGQHGMALLSRLPILADQARDFSSLLWADLPQGHATEAGLSPEALAVQRLSTAAHWDVPVQTSAGPLHIWALAATPPLFDGPEDRNGHRNHDEAAFWLRYLDGQLPQRPAAEPFVLMGNFNLDPARGEGRRDALIALLADDRLQDPPPLAAALTVDFGAKSGQMRVDYLLPSAALALTGAGVAPPDPAASRHHLVWVDITLP